MSVCASFPPSPQYFPTHSNLPSSLVSDWWLSAPSVGFPLWPLFWAWPVPALFPLWGPPATSHQVLICSHPLQALSCCSPVILILSCLFFFLSHPLYLTSNTYLPVFSINCFVCSSVSLPAPVHWSSLLSSIKTSSEIGVHKLAKCLTACV